MSVISRSATTATTATVSAQGEFHRLPRNTLGKVFAFQDDDKTKISMANVCRDWQRRLERHNPEVQNELIRIREAVHIPVGDSAKLMKELFCGDYRELPELDISGLPIPGIGDYIDFIPPAAMSHNLMYGNHYGRPFYAIRKPHSFQVQTFHQRYNNQATWANAGDSTTILGSFGRDPLIIKFNYTQHCHCISLYTLKLLSGVILPAASRDAYIQCAYLQRAITPILGECFRNISIAGNVFPAVKLVVDYLYSDSLDGKDPKKVITRHEGLRRQEIYQYQRDEKKQEEGEQWFEEHLGPDRVVPDGINFWDERTFEEQIEENETLSSIAGLFNDA